MTETAPATSPITREVVTSIPRKYDIEIHVSKVWLDEVEYVDIREYVLSLNQYGRGIVLPKSALLDVIDALDSIREQDEEPTDG